MGYQSLPVVFLIDSLSDRTKNLTEESEVIIAVLELFAPGF